MRKEEIAQLLTEFTDKEGNLVQEWGKEYLIKVSFEGWLGTTRVDMLKRGIRIVDWKRENKKQEKAKAPVTPKLRSKSLY
jgi:hypothetical protein